MVVVRAMRVRTLTIWKKGRPVWLFLLGWVFLSAIFLFLIGYSLLDPRGGLPRVTATYTETLPIEGVQRLEIVGDGIRVELAESYQRKELQAQIYGPGYAGQRLSWQLVDGTLKLQLAQYPVTANAFGVTGEPEVTLRILVPKQYEPKIAITGQWLVAEVYGCQAQELELAVQHGRVLVQGGSLQKLHIKSQNAAVTMTGTRVNYLTMDNAEGDTLMRDNQLGYWRFQSLHGNLTSWSKKISGIWELNSRWGDITIGTKKQPDNLLLDAQTKRGTLTVAYDKKPWKAFKEQHLQAGQVDAALGAGDNVVLLRSEDGNLTLEPVKY